MSELHDYNAAQLRAALASCTQVAAAGVALAHQWPTNPASPYFNERLIYQSLRRQARDAEDLMDDHVAYMRVFNAKPEGSKMTRDGGFAMRFESLFQEMTDAIAAAPSFESHRALKGNLRAQSSKLPLPIRAVEKARELRRKAYTQSEANIAAQRLLASEGMCPLQPLPIFIEIPRMRRDIDWTIGALRRFAEGLLDAVDILNAADEFLKRSEQVFPKTGSKPKAARRALPILAGMPALRSSDLAKALNISQKAAISALEELSEAGLAREFTGHQSWKCYCAEDPFLGLQDRPDQPQLTLPLPGGAFVSVAA